VRLFSTSRSRAGLTLVEVAVSFGLLGIVFSGLAMMLGQTNRAVQSGSAVMSLESRGSRTMHRIVDALRRADLASISAVPDAPFSSGAITFQKNLGYGESAVEWSTPHAIAVDANGVITISEDVGLASERATPWCSGVPALLEGEILNGIDDNGNGLSDEPGLCFTRTGSLLTIRFTLEGQTPEGVPLTRTWMTRVLCRN